MIVALGGGLAVVGSSGLVVEDFTGQVGLLLGGGFEVGAFGKPPAELAVEVLVDGSLPG
jgi:hypothetical protein